MSSLTATTPHLLPRMALKDKAAIGLGVPLGLLLVVVLGAMIWLNLQKKRNHGAVTEVDETELEAQKQAADPARAGNQDIRWKPY